MKYIGTTPSGKLVEMTPREHDLFVAAQQASNGFTIGGAASQGRQELDSDMEGFLRAFGRFVDLKFSVNEVRACVESANELLNLPRKP